VRAFQPRFSMTQTKQKALFQSVFQNTSTITAIDPFLGRPFSSSRRGRGRGKVAFAEPTPEQTPPPPAVRPEDAWEPVVDESSKQTYYWNTVTNETTALGAPKPSVATLAEDPNYQQQVVQNQYERPGFGQTLKEGFAFGAGAGIARGVIGNMFGGGGDDGDDGSGDGGEWI